MHYSVPQFSEAVEFVIASVGVTLTCCFAQKVPPRLMLSQGIMNVVKVKFIHEPVSP